MVQYIVKKYSLVQYSMVYSSIAQHSMVSLVLCRYIVFPRIKVQAKKNFANYLSQKSKNGKMELLNQTTNRAQTTSGTFLLSRFECPALANSQFHLTLVKISSDKSRFFWHPQVYVKQAKRYTHSKCSEMLCGVHVDEGI